MNLKHSSIVALFVASVALPVASADDFKPEPGFISLFNGTDLTGWSYQTNSFDGMTNSSDGRYSARDGALVVNPHKEGAGAEAEPIADDS